MRLASLQLHRTLNTQSVSFMCSLFHCSTHHKQSMSRLCAYHFSLRRLYLGRVAFSVRKRRLVALDGRAGAHEVLITVDVVDAADCWPEFRVGARVDLIEI